jgi:uncharacterized protein YbaR (Trm112 family)
MLVQVQEAGQFGIRDKLGMRLVTEDLIHTDCETYDNMEGYKLLMTLMVPDISRMSCQSCFLLHLKKMDLVFCPLLKHMLVCVHSSNEQPDMLCCNKQPVYNENKLEVYGLDPQQNCNNCMS